MVRLRSENALAFFKEVVLHVIPLYSDVSQPHQWTILSISALDRRLWCKQYEHNRKRMSGHGWRTWGAHFWRTCEASCSRSTYQSRSTHYYALRLLTPNANPKCRNSSLREFSVQCIRDRNREASFAGGLNVGRFYPVNQTASFASRTGKRLCSQKSIICGRISDRRIGLVLSRTSVEEYQPLQSTRLLSQVLQRLYSNKLTSSNDSYFRQQKSSEQSDAEDKPNETELKRALSASKQLTQRLPNISHIHRPSREELLSAATGFWSRLKVRFKWFSIRSVRPFNVDEIGAFFSWVLLGHVLWIILGTTTFFSLVILAVNTVFAQGMVRAIFVTFRNAC